MSDLVYHGKDEQPRTESPADKATARIDAILRVALVIAAVTVTTAVVVLMVASYKQAKQNETIAKTVLDYQQELTAQQDLNERLNHRIVALAEDIRDCINPEGRCAQRGAAAFAAQTGQTNAVSMASIVCGLRNMSSPETVTLSEIRSCVEELVDAP